MEKNQKSFFLFFAGATSFKKTIFFCCKTFFYSFRYVDPHLDVFHTITLTVDETDQSDEVSPRPYVKKKTKSKKLPSTENLSKLTEISDPLERFTENLVRVTWFQTPNFFRTVMQTVFSCVTREREETLEIE